MPLYEFQCRDCGALTSLLAKSVSEPLVPKCPKCGGSNLTRTISRFAYHKSTQTVWEESGEPTMTPGSDYYKDPRNIGRWTEKKFGEMGMSVPPEVKDKIDAARAGELPEELKE